MCAKDAIISGQVYATCTIGGKLFAFLNSTVSEKWFKVTKNQARYFFLLKLQKHRNHNHFNG